MVQNREEFGYPHEIISSSVGWANKAMDGSYAKRTKILAVVVLDLIGEGESHKLEVDEKDNLNYRILYHALKKNKLKLTSSIGKHEKELERLITQYEKRGSGPALTELQKFIEETIFVYLYLKLHNNRELLKKDLFEKVKLIFNSSSVGNILHSIFLLYEKNQINEATANELINQFSSIDEFPNTLYTMFLTFNLALKFPSYKNKFLFEHYRALKRSVSGLEMVSDSRNLDDTVVEKLFLTSLTLHLCGYQYSLRLPHEEKINYFEHVIARNTLSNEFKKAFNKKACFNIWSIRVPLWIAGIIDVFLIFVGLVWNLLLPAGLNFPVLSVSLPFSIPIFPVLAFILTMLIVFKIYRIKEYIAKDLKTGG